MRVKLAWLFYLAFKSFWVFRNNCGLYCAIFFVQHVFVPDRRSMPAGLSLQPVTPQSLQGKTVSWIFIWYIRGFLKNNPLSMKRQHWNFILFKACFKCSLYLNYQGKKYSVVPRNSENIVQLLSQGFLWEIEIYYFLIIVDTLLKFLGEGRLHHRTLVSPLII